MVPHCTPPAAWSDAPASRLASRIRTDDHAGCEIALIGLADDLGVKLNGGRLGAAQGPDAIRAALRGYGVADPGGWNYPAIFDAGNIIPAPGEDGRALSQTHVRVFEATTWLLERGLFPVALGGGHDLTWPFAHAVIHHAAARGTPISHGLYFDAHLDVRDTLGSGMPFRRLIEATGLTSLSLVGFNPFVNTREHRDWFVAHGGCFVDSALALLEAATSPLFVSLDLDVIDASHAPGVSAMNPAGFDVRSLQAMVEAVGACEQVKCFDLMEHSPPHDVQGRTSRVAAHLLLAFVRGFASRQGPASSRGGRS